MMLERRTAVGSIVKSHTRWIRKQEMNIGVIRKGGNQHATIEQEMMKGIYIKAKQNDHKMLKSKNKIVT